MYSNSPARHLPPAYAARGFTLIELIMVIIILGVLAVFAAPRLFDSKDFYARGFHDETLAYLRYAQKIAIAQRRTVCVTFPNTNSSLTLTMSQNAATADCTTPVALTGPNGTTTLNAKMGSGVMYSATPTSFNFNGLGQPIAATGGAAIGTRTIQVVGAGRLITVEASTGYVHD